jgi:predicted phosphodiesterase
MRICILSDSHDRGPMMAAAIAAAIAEGAEAVIHCGDIIGGNTLRASLKLGCRSMPCTATTSATRFPSRALPTIRMTSCTITARTRTLKLGGRRIFLTHYPHIGHGMACTGDYDLVCCGHSHEAEIRQQANIKGGLTWLVNPGTVAGLGAPVGDMDPR